MFECSIIDAMTSLCHRCTRHLIGDPERCPFCGAQHRVVASPPLLCALIGLSLVACANRATEDSGSDGGTGAVDGGGSTTGQASATSAASTASSATGPSSTDGTTTTTTGQPDTTSDPDTGGVTTSGGQDTVTTTGTDDGTTSTTSFPPPPYAGAYPDSEGDEIE